MKVMTFPVSVVCAVARAAAQKKYFMAADRRIAAFAYMEDHMPE